MVRRVTVEHRPESLLRDQGREARASMFSQVASGHQRARLNRPPFAPPWQLGTTNRWGGDETAGEEGATCRVRLPTLTPRDPQVLSSSSSCEWANRCEAVSSSSFGVAPGAYSVEHLRTQGRTLSYQIDNRNI